MTDTEQKYWWDTIRMCEKLQLERVKHWADLKERLYLDFAVSGTPNPIRISRFYKIVREVIASIAFRHPHIFLKAEQDPADPQTGELLSDAQSVLEDFANDALDTMQCKQKVRQIIFDALFCFRGFGKMGFLSSPERKHPDEMVAPYRTRNTMVSDFTYFSRVPAELALVDPLTPPEEFQAGRFFIEVMYPSLNDLMNDPRFEDKTDELRKLQDQTGSSSVKHSFLKPDDETFLGLGDAEKEAISEAHRLANIRKAYEVHDAVNMRRIFFLDGVEEALEEIPHPLMSDDIIRTIPDPADGRLLLSRMDSIPNPETGTAGVRPERRMLVEGGVPYFSMAFDTSDRFYGEPMMAYENPIQNAIIRSVSRRLDILDRYKRFYAISKSEVDNNPGVVDILKNGEDGTGVPLIDMNAIRELNWGGVPPDQIRIEQDLRGYESETIRTSAASRSDTATGDALAASEQELNRDYNQDPVEELYIWITRNTFNILSDPRFTPENHLLRLTSPAGSQMSQTALQHWHLRGRYNISIAAGSMSVLYASMQRDRMRAMAADLRSDPSIDQRKLTEHLIRAHGEIDPDMLMKPDANTDAAKAAELEIQMFFTSLHDPGVTPQEDHNTHIKLQSPNAIVQHPRFGQMPQNFQAAGITLQDYQRRVLAVAQRHVQLHMQARQQEAGGGGRPSAGGGSRTEPGPDTLFGQVQSNAQKTEGMVSENAQEQLAP